MSWRKCLLLCLALPLGAAGPARASGSLDTEVRALAADLKKMLDARKDKSIALGAFVGPPSFPSSAGPAIARLLGQELKRLKVEVKPRANLTVEGRYRLVEDADSSLAAVALEVKVLNKDGDELVGLKLSARGIFGDATVSSILGLTVTLAPDGTDKDRDKDIRDSFEKPKTSFDKGKTVVRPAPDSPFGIEVRVKKDGKYVPRSAVDEDGLAFVKIRREEIYAVRIVNDADFDVAVTLSIDGLNLFTFSKLRDPEGNPLYSVFVVRKKSSTTVKGWHIDNKESNEFLVSEYAKSAAAEVRSVANLGTITASFAAAWPKGGTPPADEPVLQTARAKSADATARGATVGLKWNEVERNFGVTRAAVSVRYSK